MMLPELDPGMQATEIVEPVTKWGSIARTSPMPGTYHFYTDDYKFNRLYRNPGQLPASGCRVAIEPNYSTTPDMDPAKVHECIFRKRTLARYWQSKGVRIVADLNVEPVFRAVNFIGIPEGWRAYAVRQQSGIGLEEIEADFEAAARHAGTTDLLFVVVGGWRKVKAMCAARNWTWIPESLHVARGSSDGTRRWR